MSLVLNGLSVGVVQFQSRDLVSFGQRPKLCQWSDGKLIGRRR